MTELVSVDSAVAGACSVCAGAASGEGLGVAAGVVVGSAAGVGVGLDGVGFDVVGFDAVGLAGAGRGAGVAFGAGLVWPSCCAAPGLTLKSANAMSIKT